MTTSENELKGGNVNPSIVRIGNTVRRTLTPHSASVHQLLLHLEKKGFRHSPRFLGIDANNREILSYFAGETEIPESVWQDKKALIASARLLRAYHDATQDFATDKSMRWAISHPDAAQHEVICHNDFAPYNFIFRNEIPYAVIDFDLAGPGPRLRDIAYAAYWLAPLSFGSMDLQPHTEKDLQHGSERLHLFCETYGIKPDKEIFDMVFDILSFMSSKKTMREVLGEKIADKLDAEGHLTHWKNEARAFRENQIRLETNI